MKKFLSIYGITLFLFVTYLFLNDFRGAYSYLYKSDFSPMVSPELLPKYNLSTFLMFYIYMMVLIGILLTIKFKETHIITIIGNLIISIPIFMVHKDTLFFKPFYFIYSYSHCINILMWVWYIYLSAFGGIMLVFYLFINSSKCTPQQKKRIKKVIKIGLISLASVATIYLVQCLYLSFKTDYLVRLAYDTNGQHSQKLENIITQDNFEYLNYGKYSHDKEDGTHQEFDNTFPITLLLGANAYSKYRFTYKKINIIDSLTGNFLGVRVKVKWKLKNFKWVVTDVYEYP